MKFKGIELFGTYETSSGNSQVENGEIKYSDPDQTYVLSTSNRSWQQIEADVVYRFGKNDVTTSVPNTTKYPAQQYLEQALQLPTSTKVLVRMYQLNVLPSVLAGSSPATYSSKLNMNQKYNDYPTDNILSGGKFNGLVVQGIIGF